MSDTVLLDIASLISVFGHFFTMHLILPLKRGARFSFFVFTLFTVLLFTSSYLIHLEITVLTNFVRGFIYLPICIWLYRGQLYQKLFAFFQNFLLTAFQAALALEIARYIVPFESERYILCFLIVYTVMFSVYLALLHLFWKRIFRKLFVDARRSEWILYSFGAVFSYFALTALRITLQTGLVYTIMLLFVLWSFCIFCFSIINTHEKTKQRLDAAFARGMVSTGQAHYRKVDELYDKIRTLRHDYKYHLSAARNLLHSGDAEQAERYIDSVDEQLSRYEIKRYCANAVLNALVADYAERCGALGIELTVRLDIPESLSVPDYDLCIILGNLMENAVEACSKLTHNRVIIAEAHQKATKLLLMVKNSFSGAPDQENDTPISTKTNGGFGLRSVREVTDRHGGDLLMNWEGGTFTVYASVRL